MYDFPKSRCVYLFNESHVIYVTITIFTSSHFPNLAAHNIYSYCIIDNREAKMPDSPASNSTPLSMPSASVSSIASSPVNTHPPNSGPIVHDGRPVTSINPTIVNGHPSSPGRSLSPSLANGSQLPPTCGARQLSKLKRFLTTLQQFGSDISPEIGERVRSLIVSLVVSLNM